jgi:hypothetical protein
MYKMGIRFIEYLLGLGTTIIVSVLSNAMNILAIYGFGIDPRVASVLFLKIIGVALGYIADMLFAKQEFNGQYIPFHHIYQRIRILFYSFITIHFFKFCMVSIFSALLFYALYSVALQVAHKIDEKPKYWRYGLASSISVLSFIFIINPLRFFWAYEDRLSPTIEIGIGFAIVCFYIFFIIVRSYGYFSYSPQDIDQSVMVL